MYYTFEQKVKHQVEKNKAKWREQDEYRAQKMFGPVPILSLNALALILGEQTGKLQMAILNNDNMIEERIIKTAAALSQMHDYFIDLQQNECQHRNKTTIYDRFDSHVECYDCGKVFYKP